ncbi:hypothetical protein Poly30_43500 [Planctomycetes bacterium Poly30]|uniref:Uncharacterized protein n=1 Tax=Saltatorellus ferox TaxID=2528018 RepID=A0A518EXI1_9BACT|nr:hypothetical protein Poly30_43500 [Planctomycetes bacterium Poly30]
MTKGIPVCIECGGPVNALNEDEHGDPCVACAERLLETLPGVFHAPWGQEAAELEDADAETALAQGEEEPGGGTPPPRSGGRGQASSRRGGESFGDSFGEPRGSA